MVVLNGDRNYFINPKKKTASWLSFLVMEPVLFNAILLKQKELAEKEGGSCGDSLHACHDGDNYGEKREHGCACGGGGYGRGGGHDYDA